MKQLPYQDFELIILATGLITEKVNMGSRTYRGKMYLLHPPSRRPWLHPLKQRPFPWPPWNGAEEKQHQRHSSTNLNDSVSWTSMNVGMVSSGATRGSSQEKNLAEVAPVATIAGPLTETEKNREMIVNPDADGHAKTRNHNKTFPKTWKTTYWKTKEY